ncbi:helix-turn-helix domain-containing protein [Nocardia sp. NPDC051981]|uniref:helix-turn-helix domain-containing protein n=1 Tax=Nocardia sp. NPDC051981 TaxID=3155417 RepID=UPI003426434A
MSAEQSSVIRLCDRREQLTLRIILTTARRLFAESGYTGTSIRSIAREAGVAPQTIYSHFGSKAGVLRGTPRPGLGHRAVGHTVGSRRRRSGRHGPGTRDEMRRLVARAATRSRLRHTFAQYRP